MIFGGRRLQRPGHVAVEDGQEQGALLAVKGGGRPAEVVGPVAETERAVEATDVEVLAELREVRTRLDRLDARLAQRRST